MNMWWGTTVGSRAMWYQTSVTSTLFKQRLTAGLKPFEWLGSGGGGTDQAVLGADYTKTNDLVHVLEGINKRETLMNK